MEAGGTVIAPPALDMAASQAMLEQQGLVESPLIEPKKPRAPREKRERAPEVVPDRTLRNRETIKRPRDANFVDDQDDRFEKMEQQLALERDPDSLAFFNASKLANARNRKQPKGASVRAPKGAPAFNP